ncbi:MAG TPA: hypothetical protein VH619_11115 [Verrucomicrobiae bacterium]|jgi:hypothetical protein|nr:hypothetical protein [Verrucomicrobiae bacterium]
MMCRFVRIFAFLSLTPALWAGTGQVVKVLPQFLDKKGRTYLSPSLYERDAYQFVLRKSPARQAGLDLTIQWKAKHVDWTKLKLRAELRGLTDDTIHTITIEEPAKKPRFFGNWSDLKIDGEAFHSFGKLVAWRVTLWEGDHQLGELKSFLWTGVTAH